MEKEEQPSDAVITKVITKMHLVEGAELYEAKTPGEGRSPCRRKSISVWYILRSRRFLLSQRLSVSLVLAADMSNLHDGIWPFTTNDLIPH